MGLLSNQRYLHTIEKRKRPLLQMQQPEPQNIVNDYASSTGSIHQKELFSVAPMMGHTNRHYRYFFRLMSKRSHLYTEMIPSSQICQAYLRVRDIYLKGRSHTNDYIHPEEVLEVVQRWRDNPEKEQYYFNAKMIKSSSATSTIDRNHLSELIGLSSSVEHPVVLQLGGRSADKLSAASMIGAAFHKYDAINLNCGCPSNAVGGRSGGAALMRDPDLVANCVEKMNASVMALKDLQDSIQEDRKSGHSIITVKHRIGVKDAYTYDAQADRNKNDMEAIEACRRFVKTVTMSGAVTKCHIHARLALLGEFPSEDDQDDNNKESQGQRKNRMQSLWVPNTSAMQHSTSNSTRDGESGIKLEKIDHKREQQRARKRSRQATIKNRNVPPLRPNVVHMLAEEMPELEFIVNGGIQSLNEVKQVIDQGTRSRDKCNGGVVTERGGGGGVVGAMIGRAAINHPCAFASADKLWEEQEAQLLTRKATVNKESRPSRGEVLQDYMLYCDQEEERVLHLGACTEQIEVLRRRLVAVPFHLFMGEEGSDAFQRRLRKLIGKSLHIKASSILSGAASFIPDESLNKCVDDFVPVKSMQVYDGYRRSSAMQRMIF